MRSVQPGRSVGLFPHQKTQDIAAFVVNTASGGLAEFAFDGAQWNYLSTLAVGGELFDAALTPDRLRGLVSVRSGNQVIPISRVGGTWTLGTPLAVSTAPLGISISADGQRAVVGTDNLLVYAFRWSGTTWVQVGSPVSLGGGTAGCYKPAIAPDGQTVLAGDNRFTVFAYNFTDTGLVAAGSFTTSLNPWVLAIAPDGQTALCANSALAGTISQFRLVSGAWTKPAADLSLGTSPRSVLILPDSQTALVTDYFGGNIYRLVRTTGNWVYDSLILDTTDNLGAIGCDKTGQHGLVSVYSTGELIPFSTQGGLSFGSRISAHGENAQWMVII